MKNDKLIHFSFLKKKNFVLMIKIINFLTNKTIKKELLDLDSFGYKINLHYLVTSTHKPHL